MTSESDLERRVYRVESETVAIYDQISDLRAETRAGFAETRAGFAETRAGFAETRTRFDRVEATLDEVLKRLPEPT